MGGAHAQSAQPINHTLPIGLCTSTCAMEVSTSIDPKRPKLDTKNQPVEVENEATTSVPSEETSSSTLQLQEVTVYSSEEENGDSSSSISDEEEEEEEEEGNNDMRSQVKEFFAELKLDEGKQKRRLMGEGVRIPKRKSLLPSHLHSVMGNANLRLARGDTGAAIELCMEVIRQGEWNKP